MFDNGLLKYYAEHNYRNGLLDAKDIGLVEEEKVTHRVKACNSEAGRLFKRINGDRLFDKMVTDSQVLLSQIYNRAGLASAVYFPAQNKGKKFLLSNSVVSSETKIASDYIEGFPKYEYRFPIDFLNSRHSGNIVEQYFTDRALIQQSIMRVYDLACYNNDRHYANFFYKLLDGKADDIVGIDFEVGSCAFFPDDKLTDVFFNDFDTNMMSRNGLLERFKEDENFAILIDKPQLAEEIGSINPIDVAQDIKQTIGYQVDPKLPELLSRSFDEVAETLIQ